MMFLSASKRSGVTVLECTVALAVLAAGLVIAAQVLTVCVENRRHSRTMLAVQLEAANMAEQLAAMSFDEITPSGLDRISLSPTLHDWLPDANIAYRSVGFRQQRIAAEAIDDRNHMDRRRRNCLQLSIDDLEIPVGNGGQQMTSQITRYSRCCGTTLVEMVAVIALTSVVMGVIGLLLNSAWRMQRSLETDDVVIHSISSLAQQLRDDVHRAYDATMPESESTKSLTLSLPDNISVEFSAANDGIERVARSGGNIVQRESYLLVAGTSAQWQISPLKSRRVVTLQLQCPIGPNPHEFTERRQMRIDAVISLVPDELQIDTPVQ